MACILISRNNTSHYFCRVLIGPCFDPSSAQISLLKASIADRHARLQFVPVCCDALVFSARS